MKLPLSAALVVLGLGVSGHPTHASSHDCNLLEALHKNQLFRVEGSLYGCNQNWGTCVHERWSCQRELKKLQDDIEEGADPGNEPETQAKVEASKQPIHLEQIMYFSIGSSVPEPASFANLASLIENLRMIEERFAKDNIEWTLHIQGHADRIPVSGGLRSNWHLATMRALYVLELLAQEGIPEQRMVIESYGVHRPSEFDSDRRVELTVRTLN